MSSEPLQFSDEDLQRELLPRVAALRTFVDRKIPDRLRRLVGPDDVLQEVWIAAYRNASAFAPDGPRAIDRWLSTIATSKVIDAIRAARRIKRGGDRCQVDENRRRMTSLAGLFDQVSSPVRSPSSDARRAERAHAVSIALSRLTTQRHRAVYLRHIEGLTYAEIAHQMDTTEDAVNSLIYNGLRDLRRFLGEAAKYFSDVHVEGSSQD